MNQEQQDLGVRIGVIGTGGWGMNHVRTWSDLGYLSAICDASTEHLAAAVKAHGDAVFATTNAKEMISRPDLDGIVIATPAVTHAQLAIQALEAGKHVLVEKPLAVTLETAEAIVEASKSTKRIAMVGHVLEYHPAVLALRLLIERGDLGRLRYLYSNRLNFGKVRTEENSLWSFAPHDLALCLRLVGTFPTDVACHGASFLNLDVPDVTLMSMTFPAGTKAHVFVSWLHPFKEQRFVVVGEKSMAVFDDTLPWDEKLVLYAHEVGWLHGRVPEARRARGMPVPLDPAEPLREECLHFANAIVLGTPVLTDCASALDVLRLLDAAERSMRSEGAPILLAGIERDREVFVHPTATLDDGCVIGRETKIWHYTHVMTGARIGARCSLGQNCFVASGVRIGDDVKIQNNVSVYDGVELADGVFCGPSVVFTNVINPRATIERKEEYRATSVARGASLGANCTIVCGVQIGEHALVGAGAVVTNDVPAHALVTGVPARRQGWVCSCGVTLGQPNSGGSFVCDSCGVRYVLQNPDHLIRESAAEDLLS